MSAWPDVTPDYPLIASTGYPVLMQKSPPTAWEGAFRRSGMPDRMVSSWRPLRDAKVGPAAIRSDPPIWMKGSEVAALLRERLGVSRSTYYERFRQLLRTYAVSPRLVFRMQDGSLDSCGRATLRFRWDGVEAMLDFLGSHAA
jgi:hypothetical protein